jgi:hypothetical protein
LPVANWQDAILVNMLGKRFYDETGGQFTANDYNSIKDYAQDSYLNAKNAGKRRIDEVVGIEFGVGGFSAWQALQLSPATTCLSMRKP